jgi:hypothetical protein
MWFDREPSGMEHGEGSSGVVGAPEADNVAHLQILDYHRYRPQEGGIRFLLSRSFASVSLVPFHMAVKIPGGEGASHRDVVRL